MGSPYFYTHSVKLPIVVLKIAFHSYNTLSFIKILELNSLTVSPSFAENMMIEVQPLNRKEKMDEETKKRKSFQEIKG